MSRYRRAGGRHRPNGGNSHRLGNATRSVGEHPTRLPHLRRDLGSRCCERRPRTQVAIGLADQSGRTVRGGIVILACSAERGVRETGRRGLSAESALRCGLLSNRRKRRQDALEAPSRAGAGGPGWTMGQATAGREKQVRRRAATWASVLAIAFGAGLAFGTALLVVASPLADRIVAWSGPKRFAPAP